LNLVKIKSIQTISKNSIPKLNLKKCEDTLIGVAQLGLVGISGGEKRRLAFASEV
jgi:hypothetical protein